MPKKKKKGSVARPVQKKKKKKSGYAKSRLLVVTFNSSLERTLWGPS